MGEKRERRMCTRTPFPTDVTLRLKNVDTGIRAELRDISLSGMFVRIDQLLPVGTACTMEIRVTGKHSRLLLEDIEGEVVRQEEQGIGIQLTFRMEWIVLFTIYTHYCRQAMEKGGEMESGS